MHTPILQQATVDHASAGDSWTLMGKSGLVSCGITASFFLQTKVRIVKAMVFPVVMYGCESWTIKKLSAEELMLLSCDIGEDC